MHAIMSVILTIVLSVASATAGIRHYCDYLGSIRAIVNTDGDVVADDELLPLGSAVQPNGAGAGNRLPAHRQAVP